MSSVRLQQSQRVAQGQSLVMTPQLTQSIKLLAMSNVELDAFVAEEAARNPLLKERARPKDAPTPRPPAVGRGEPFGHDIWERIEAPRTLTAHLTQQVVASSSSREVCEVAKLIVADLDEQGQLVEPERLRRLLGVSTGTFDLALSLVRSLEPAGVGARDLADGLALQLRARNRLDPAMQAILGNLELIARSDRSGLIAVSGLSEEDLSDALAEIRALDPRPAARFQEAHLVPAPPDILLGRDPRGAWRVQLNPQTLPRVVADRDYHATISAGLRTPKDRAYVADAWQTATWLERAMDQRARTILKVTQAIVAEQDAFFDLGVRALVPLTMQKIAETIGMHESTISRVANAKTLLGPRGMVTLRSLFTTALPARGGGLHSSAAVQDRIREMVATEGRDVLSDEAIVSRLKGDGVEIARRTVAKYRDVLAIPSSVQRRRAAPASAHIAAGAGM